MSRLSLLLDSHVLLWWLEESARLTNQARQAIMEADAYVSPVSAWELEIKSAAGKLKTPGDLEEQLKASRFIELPVTVAHAVAAARLPPHHKNPFDRLLIAQAICESLTLLTVDARIRAYNVPMMLA